ncbi:MAG: hypothetical protein WCE61_01900 [Candidatus Acidiferrum sp.]
MKSDKSFLLAILVAALALVSCSGVPKGGGGGGGGNTADVSLVMVSDTLPANIGIVSFVVTINSVQLTSSTGVQTNLALNGGKGITVDLARLQSDSAFLGTVTGVPTGTNSSITLSFGTTAKLAFYNGTGATITSLNPTCAPGQVCAATYTVVGTPTITASQTISGNTGIGIDFNLANSLVLSGTSLSINLTNSGNNNVVSSFSLPRTNSNLSAGQLDLIEDFTGVVTLGSPGVTITSDASDGRGSIAASSATGTVYDQDPTQSYCPGGTTSLSGCVTTNGAASMDAILNSDGTFTVREIEPLLHTLQDTVEGTVVYINPNNQTQFDIVTTDIIPAATSSKIGTLGLGDPITMTLSNVIANGFYVDTKGLPVASLAPASYNDFFGQTTTSAIHPGQSVAVHITSFTAASGTTPASANTDSVTLRWSRFIASPVAPSSNTLFNLNSLPGYFGFTQASVFQVQSFMGTQGAPGVTNLDGIAPQNGPATPTPPVGVRALYLQNATNNANPAFVAAKVRQH